MKAITSFEFTTEFKANFNHRLPYYPYLWYIKKTSPPHYLPSYTTNLLLNGDSLCFLVIRWSPLGQSKILSLCSAPWPWWYQHSSFIEELKWPLSEYSWCGDLGVTALEFYHNHTYSHWGKLKKLIHYLFLQFLVNIYLS